jgi:restriction system protein
LSQPGRRWGWLVLAALTALLLAWFGYRWLGHPAWYDQLPLAQKQLISLIETAAATTCAFIWTGLWWHQQRREQAQERDGHVALPHLLALAPDAFEAYVARLFRTKGYGVAHRGRSGDLGVDLELIDRRGRRAIVQCKRYQNTVGAVVVRELYGTLVHEGVAHAFLVTTGDISDAARRWAAGKPLTLIDGQTLVAIANQAARA